LSLIRQLTEGDTLAQLAQLRVHGQGEVEVDLVIAYLNDLRFAYNSICVFEESIDSWQRTSRRFGFPVLDADIAYGRPGFRRAGRSIREAAFGTEDVVTLVPKSQQLVLTAVSLHSPGFWEFLGKLSPLEVLRQYLNDRHERRKDLDYREGAEKRRLRLENLKLENEAIKGRIEIPKSLGASERDLEPLLNQLVYRPLAGLDRHQDLGTINLVDPPRRIETPRG
jgi:hypothetical protein